MNKIIVDTKEFGIKLQEDLFLDIKSDTIIRIKVDNNKNNKLLINSYNNKIEINLEILDNGILEINNLGINSSIDYNIKMNNNCNLVIVDSIISNVDSINNINIRSIGINNNCYFATNGINLENNKLYFNLNGIVEKDSLNSVLNEHSTIINMGDGDSKIIPNLIIDTKEVIANHSAYIGTFDKEVIYYLASRGIKIDDAKELLIKSILLAHMELDKEEFIKEIENFLNRG